MSYSSYTVSSYTVSSDARVMFVDANYFQNTFLAENDEQQHFPQE